MESTKFLSAAHLYRLSPRQINACLSFHFEPITKDKSDKRGLSVLLGKGLPDEGLNITFPPYKCCSRGLEIGLDL